MIYSHVIKGLNSDIMIDKTIRTSFGTWLKLREIAYLQNTHIKTVVEEIITGKINPMEIEVK